LGIQDVTVQVLSSNGTSGAKVKSYRKTKLLVNKFMYELVNHPMVVSRIGYGKLILKSLNMK
jgi:hypothetical protein